MQRIPNFDGARVLVVGDVMLDRYWHGDTGRISPEAPVPVVRIDDEELRMGGAGNVALNLARLGVQTTLLGVIGDDEPGRTVRRLCAEAGIDARFVRSPDRPTVAKLRVLSRNQQLIRLDFEESYAPPAGFDRDGLREAFGLALDRADMVVFSDYDKGTLVQVADLIAAAREAGKLVLVDPKGDDWSRYRGASLMTPNLGEFEAVAGHAKDEADLAGKARELRRELALEGLLVTRSERGMSLFSDSGDVHLPAQAREVFDVTGAGDTVIALLAAGLAVGETPADAAQIANLGAGVVVGKLGAASVSVAELRRAARVRHADGAGILDEDKLLAYVEEARAHGERVVMTNGCFDLLHPGHIRYLEAARELGDWLVVAVNDDESVQRLKGEGRPVNPLHYRMEMLLGLAAVDWVVPFSEDTPERLICRIRPDVLVKGGDYDPDEVAGADCVREAGGEVRVLDFVPGYSSTDILRRLRHED